MRIMQQLVTTLATKRTTGPGLERSVRLSASSARFKVLQPALALLVALLVLLFSLASSLVIAQSASLNDAASAALQKGQAAASRALVTYDAPNLDQPLWRDAVRYGEEAKSLAPGRKEPLRFLAQVYSTVGFYSRAWEAWTGYYEAGGLFDAQARSQFVTIGKDLGYAAYQAGNVDEALLYYSTVDEVQPGEPEVGVWLGRLNFERGDLSAALPYWQEATRQNPDNKTYADLLARTQNGLTYGVAASSAFYRGVDAAQAGREEEALAAFREALNVNPQYKEAFVRAANLSDDLGRPGDARDLWARVLALDPNDANARAALERAQAQARWGVAAVNAFQEGVARFNAGSADAAAASFRRATDLNPAYADAWAWRGRVALEGENLTDAATFYDRARQLEPTNAGYSARYDQVTQTLTAQAQAEAEAEAEAQAAAAAQKEAQAAAQEEARAAAQAERERIAQEQAAQEQAAQAAAEAARREAQAAAAQAEKEAQAAAEAQAQAAQAEGEAQAEREAAEEAAREAQAAQASLPATPETLPEASAPTEAPVKTPAETPTALAASPAIPAPDTPPATTEAPTGTPDAPSDAPNASQPLVLLDVTYTHLGDAEGGPKAFSLFDLATLPADLTSPVDYADGTLYQRLEVIRKPSDLPVTYQFCAFQAGTGGTFAGFGSASSYACTNRAGFSFTYPGTYETSQPMRSLERYGTVDWQDTLGRAMLVLEDADGNPVDDRYGFAGSWYGSPVFDFYFPMDVRYTALIVPPGGTFTGWP